VGPAPILTIHKLEIALQVNILWEVRLSQLYGCIKKVIHLIYTSVWLRLSDYLDFPLKPDLLEYLCSKRKSLRQYIKMGDIGRTWSIRPIGHAQAYAQRQHQN
jgi:hypothetical protein